MYITKRQKEIIEEMLWYAGELGMFDKDHSGFLDIKEIDIKEIEELKIKLNASIKVAYLKESNK